MAPRRLKPRLRSRRTLFRATFITTKIRLHKATRIDKRTNTDHSSRYGISRTYVNNPEDISLKGDERLERINTASQGFCIEFEHVALADTQFSRRSIADRPVKVAATWARNDIHLVTTLLAQRFKKECSSTGCACECSASARCSDGICL